MSDDEYGWFVSLWEEPALADTQLAAPYEILGGKSALRLLRPRATDVFRSSHPFYADVRFAEFAKRTR